MVQALLDISDNANRVLNVIKAKYNLKDKSQAVEYLVNNYIDETEDQELRPEFIERIKKAEKGPFVRVGTIEDFRKRYGPKNVQRDNRQKA